MPESSTTTTPPPANNFQSHIFGGKCELSLLTSTAKDSLYADPPQQWPQCSSFKVQLVPTSDLSDRDQLEHKVSVPGDNLWNHSILHNSVIKYKCGTVSDRQHLQIKWFKSSSLSKSPSRHFLWTTCVQSIAEEIHFRMCRSAEITFRWRHFLVSIFHPVQCSLGRKAKQSSYSASVAGTLHTCWIRPDNIVSSESL